MGREDDEDDAIMLQAKQQITNNVITKRKEQLRRWQSSEMNGESSRRNKKPRVQFQDSDIFLSACMSGDEEEVEELLSKGADINTCTIDGLTALHQSVIDSKPDMVRFLCEKGADLNAQDNEGWTPLHAAACCGNVSIVQYLCQKGADLTIVNSDKELPLDLADDEQCRDTLEKNYERQKIDVEACRDRELATMMHDVQTWINVGEYRDVPHVRTGGTAMHVAAARGYTQLLELLVKAGGNVHARDKDGWTPLHAAAHWAERDACKILIENNASVSDVTFANQDVLAVADKEIVEYLEELAAAQAKNDRRKSPSVPVAVLQDKNHRSSSHEEHIISAEKKKEIQHKDQISENEILHKAPAPKMAEFSPSRESSSSATTVEKKKIADIEKRSPSENSRSSVEISPLRSSVEKSPSVPRSVDLRSSERESTSRESSLETRTSATASTASSAAVDRSPTSSQNSQRSVSLPPSASPTTNESRSSAESSSLQSGDQEVSATLPMVPPPRALNQSASSWINRGVQLISRSTSSSRSGTSSASGSTEPSSTPPPSATVQPIVTASSATTSSVPSSATPPVSAKQSPSPAGSVSVTATFTRPPRWQSKTVTESEAERRNNSRMQRQHRRSTQGVTKEQLEEASRLASEETARRHSAVSSTSAPSSAIVRLASEERDLTNSESERSQPERDGDVSATASVPLNSMSNNQANVRRKSQALSFSRTNRRGTGPVMADDVVQAAALRTNGGHGDIASSPTTLRLAAVSATSPSTFSSTSSSSATTPRAYISGTSMSSAASRYSNGEDKATSLPPSSHTSSVAQSAASQRSAVVAGLSTAPSSARVVTATSRFGPTNVSTSTPSYLAQSRPTETNLNYKALYEKERAECDRLRKEVDELRRSNDRPSSNSTSTSNWRLRNTSPSSNASASLTVAKSSSLASFDESERRSMERRITDLESQLKELKKLRNDNDRLKEENGALVRVISKMTS